MFIPKVPKTFEEMPGEINFSIHDEYTGVPIEESDEIQVEDDPDDLNPEKDDEETDKNEIKETMNHQENSDEPIESAETNSHNNAAADDVVDDDDDVDDDNWSLW